MTLSNICFAVKLKTSEIFLSLLPAETLTTHQESMHYIRQPEGSARIPPNNGPQVAGSLHSYHFCSAQQPANTTFL